MDKKVLYSIIWVASLMSVYLIGKASHNNGPLKTTNKETIPLAGQKVVKKEKCPSSEKKRGTINSKDIAAKRPNFYESKTEQIRVAQKCKNGSHKHCVLIRELYKLRGQISRFLKSVEAGCENKIWDDCSQLLLTKSYPADKAKRIRQIMSRECSNGNGAACSKFALIHHYARGPRYGKKAKDLFKKACQFDSTQCFYLGQTLEGKNTKEAENQMDRSCDYGNGDSCAIVGHYYLERGNVQKAEFFFLDGCQRQNNIFSCLFYLDILQANGRKKEALSFLTETCKTHKNFSDKCKAL